MLTQTHRTADRWRVPPIRDPPATVPRRVRARSRLGACWILNCSRWPIVSEACWSNEVSRSPWPRGRAAAWCRPRSSPCRVRRGTTRAVLSSTRSRPIGHSSTGRSRHRRGSAAPPNSSPRTLPAPPSLGLGARGGLGGRRRRSDWQSLRRPVGARLARDRRPPGGDAPLAHGLPRPPRQHDRLRHRRPRPARRDARRLTRQHVRPGRGQPCPLSPRPVTCRSRS